MVTKISSLMCNKFGGIRRINAAFSNDYISASDIQNVELFNTGVNNGVGTRTAKGNISICNLIPEDEKIINIFESVQKNTTYCFIHTENRNVCGLGLINYDRRLWIFNGNILWYSVQENIYDFRTSDSKIATSAGFIEYIKNITICSLRNRKYVYRRKFNMNKYKFINKFKLYKIINPIALIIKHILFFIKSFFVILKDNIIVNIIVVLLIGYIYCLSGFVDDIKYMLYGALCSILLTLNILTAGERYRAEIIWDGDIRILKSEKYNFEHKIDSYYMLSRDLSRIIFMITKYFGRTFVWGIISSYNDFKKTAEHFSLWRFKNKEFDLSYIDELNSFNIFSNYINSFNDIEEVITSIQCVQTQLNTFCPYEYVKASLALLLNELLITRYNVIRLRKFISESSVFDNADVWRNRLLNLYHNNTITSSIIENNIKNLVQHLSIMYKDINKDYDFSKKYKNE